MQFAQVMDGGVQLPFAATTLQTTHAEAIRALEIRHLSKDRLHRSAALAINRLTPLRAQLTFHPLSRRHRLRIGAPRGRRITQGCPLIAILADGDEQIALLALARRIGLRPVAGIGDGSPKGRALARHGLDVHLSLIEHHRELVDVARLVRHIGGRMIWRGVTTACLTAQFQNLQEDALHPTGVSLAKACNLRMVGDCVKTMKR